RSGLPPGSRPEAPEQSRPPKRGLSEGLDARTRSFVRMPPDGTFYDVRMMRLVLLIGFFRFGARAMRQDQPPRDDHHEETGSVLLQEQGAQDVFGCPHGCPPFEPLPLP